MPAPDRRFDTAACDRTMPREGWLRPALIRIPPPAHRTALRRAPSAPAANRRHTTLHAPVHRAATTLAAPDHGGAMVVASPRPETSTPALSKTRPWRVAPRKFLLPLVSTHRRPGGSDPPAGRAPGLRRRRRGGCPPRRALAAAVELIHTASLIHDDINDRSDTAPRTLDRELAWATTAPPADFVFVRLLGLLPRPDGPVIQALADACPDAVEGDAPDADARAAPISPRRSTHRPPEDAGFLPPRLTPRLGRRAQRGFATPSSATGAPWDDLQLRDDVLDLAAPRGTGRRSPAT